MTKTNPFNPGYYSSSELQGMGFKYVGQDVQIAKNCTILGLENISIGDNVRIDGGSTLACATGDLIIGSYIHIGGYCHLTCSGGISLGDFSGLSQGVRIYSVSDDYSGDCLTNPTVPRAFLNVTTAAVDIGKHVIIGSGSVVLPGASIGDGASVGALSLVNKPLESWGVYCGAPARRLKTRSKALLQQEAELLEARGRALPVL